MTDFTRQVPALPADMEWLGGEPPSTNGFLLEVTGIEIGLFTEVSGLSLTVGVEPLEEGGQNGYVHKLPGRVTWPNIVMKRGLVQSDALFQWVSQSDGPFGEFDQDRSVLQRTLAAITVVNYHGKRLRSWEISAAFPVQWSGPTFSASDGSAMTESLEIAHHGFKSKAIT